MIFEAESSSRSRWIHQGDVVLLQVSFLSLAKQIEWKHLSQWGDRSKRCVKNGAQTCSNF